MFLAILQQEDYLWKPNCIPGLSHYSCDIEVIPTGELSIRPDTKLK
jgi:hypothetical protein